MQLPHPTLSKGEGFKKFFKVLSFGEDLGEAQYLHPHVLFFTIKSITLYSKYCYRWQCRYRPEIYYKKSSTPLI